MNSKPEISVVILCYKAQDFIPPFVSKVKEILDKENFLYELVLVANYNKNEKDLDRTPVVVKELSLTDSRIKVVSKEKQGMMGWDVRSGLEVAIGRTIAIIDGDGQMPPEDIIKVYRLLKEGGYDMVTTYRAERHDGLWRIFVSRIYNMFMKLFFPMVKVKDANSKPKIFKREAIQKMKLTYDDWFLDAEMIIQASYFNFKIGETPTVFYKNSKRASFVKPMAIVEFIKNFLIYRIRHLNGFK